MFQLWKVRYPSRSKALPSNQKGYREPERDRYEDYAIYSVCGWCNQNTDMTGGIYDDGEWMCGGCIARYAKF